jgi:hypothetical protein
MTEPDFWPHLEHRVSHELAGLRDPSLRALWCDGFLPSAFHTGPPGPRITGHTWIARGGRHQEEWHFTLLLAPHTLTPDQIDWPTLLPPEDVTGWLSLDTDRKTMTINPLAAYPDLASPDE